MAALLGLGACAGQGTGLGLQLVSPTQVAELGEQSWAQIKGQTPASTDAGAKERANRVESRGLRGPGENPADGGVVVFPGPEAHAFALPGNTPRVYEGRVQESGRG